MEADIDDHAHRAQEHRLCLTALVLMNQCGGGHRFERGEHAHRTQIGEERALDRVGVGPQSFGRLGQNETAVEAFTGAERSTDSGRSCEDLAPNQIGLDESLVTPQVARILEQLDEPGLEAQIAGSASTAASEASTSSRDWPMPSRKTATSGAASWFARALVSSLTLVRWSSSPRRRALTRSAVSTVLAPPLAGEGLAGVAGDQLVESGALAVPLAQDAAEALHVLAHRSAARDDDRDVRRRDVDAFVQHLRGHDGAVAPPPRAPPGSRCARAPWSGG